MTSTHAEPPPMPPPRDAAPLSVRVRAGLAIAVSFVILLVGGAAMLLVALLTLFQARRFYAEVMGANMAQAALWLHGVRVVQHREGPLPTMQTVYISNHPSLLDVFVLMSLGLPNCRYFMSGFLRWIVPFALVASLVGTFWTPRQLYPERRRRLFKHAADTLRRTGESVYLTPEGQTWWVYNKGAFHLATDLKAPIQPMFIVIEPHVNPGPWKTCKGIEVRPGVVDIYFGPRIDTSDWRVEDVERHRDEMRAMYIDWAWQLRVKHPHSVLA